jgi:hypothetical protein
LYLSKDVDARAQLLILATIGSLETSNFKFLIQNKNEMTLGALLQLLFWK